jgi:glycosyltransferase involved in cell wall biosynthesis
MRIALITPGFSADEGDWCIPWLLNLTRGLATEHDLHLFTLRYPHRRGSYAVGETQVQAFGGGATGGWRRLPLLVAARAAILAEHRRRPFDILHGLWADEPGFLAVAAARRLRLPAVVSLLGGELVGFPDLGYGGQLSRANRWLTATALATAERVTVGSTYLRHLTQAHVAPDRLLLWPLGVDTGLFRPEGERIDLAGSIRLLHVAGLSPVKDQATLLRAFTQAAPQLPGLHLHLVGAGPLLPALTEQAHALGLARQLTFHGQIAHDRLPAFYRAADLFVLSSRFESQSLAVLEAIACGCPVVGAAVGILPDLLPPDRLAAPGDADALAAAIVRACAGPGQGQARPERATPRLDGLTLAHTLAALEQIYRQITASAPPM